MPNWMEVIEAANAPTKPLPLMIWCPKAVYEGELPFIDVADMTDFPDVPTIVKIDDNTPPNLIQCLTKGAIEFPNLFIVWSECSKYESTVKRFRWICPEVVEGKIVDTTSIDQIIKACCGPA